jgi:hypothetical protein
MTNIAAIIILVNTNKWAIDEVNVPVIPQKRVYPKMQLQFNKRYPNIHNTFIHYQYPDKKENNKVLP